MKDIDSLLRSKKVGARNRSELIRRAVHELIGKLEREADEKRERDLFRRYREKINRQAAALVKEQAKP